MKRFWLVPVLGALIAAPAIGAIDPAKPPAPCDDDFYAEQLGTEKPDRMRATGRPERIFGLGGADKLRGSDARVSCLFGGPGRDRLDLAGGGGIAYGEEGDDTVVGSPVNDQLFGGPGLDHFDAGDGDDRIESDDGRPEVVYCGDGNDLVTADRIDVLVACETVVVNGPDALRLSVPGTAGPRETVRVAMTAPFAARRGAYKVILVTAALGRRCVDGPAEIGRAPRSSRVRAGERLVFRLSPPGRERWCPGAEKAAVVLERGHRPDRPVARFQFGTR